MLRLQEMLKHGTLKVPAVNVNDSVGRVSTEIVTVYPPGIPLLVPSVEEPWSLETTAGPADSGLTIYMLPGVPALPPGSRDAALLQSMAKARENSRYLPGIRLPDYVSLEPDLVAALSGPGSCSASSGSVPPTSETMRASQLLHW